ncbi:MAG: methyltransferase domain-containing protein [Anaerolineae bacterium]|nr:methyltransferase domain-containing protein [Anaerolineae bacterium]
MFHVLQFSGDEDTVNDAPPNIPICDYEGSDYRARFWQNQGREYEDLTERFALRKLLPPRGDRLLEIGTGFGRLVDMYQGYDRIALLDYSKSLLQEAQQRLGTASKYTYIAGNVYHLPFDAAQFDAVCMIRVIHHLADVPSALSQIAHILKLGGILILEFASKFHTKSILRYAMRRQTWSPFNLEPVEFAELNFDFHPRWMRQQLVARGFQIERTRSLSHFRIPLLKRFVPARLLAVLDRAFQPTGQWWPLTPSIMLRAKHTGTTLSPNPGELTFRCPRCGTSTFERAETMLHCTSCGACWRIDNGIYDFKTPIES